MTETTAPDSAPDAETTESAAPETNAVRPPINERIMQLWMSSQPDSSAVCRHMLGQLLREIEACEPDPILGTPGNYRQRADLIWRAVALASVLGYRLGIKIARDSEDNSDPLVWPLIVIDLPRREPDPVGGVDIEYTDQVSWHMLAYPRDWDGHTTREKYARCRAYTEAHR